MVDVSGSVPRFVSYDGVELAYRLVGHGRPLLCVPGGPGRAAAYLGDLGGLSAYRQLVLLDNRGTGESAQPTDESSYRAERLVQDVEALRLNLGLETFDLLGHSAGGNVATLYAARYPQRVRRLVLVTSGFWATVVDDGSFDEALAVMRTRASQPWFPAAYQAVRRALTGETSPELTVAMAPLWYGRWDQAAAAHAADEQAQRSRAAAAGYRAGPAPFGDLTTNRAALAKLPSPVLVLVGDLDPRPTPQAAEQFAALLPDARVVVQPGAAHYPWLDDPARFAQTVNQFLA